MPSDILKSWQIKKKTTKITPLRIVKLNLICDNIQNAEAYATEQIYCTY